MEKKKINLTYPLIQEFKDREDTQFILDWLYEEDLITQEDIEKGLQLREQWWARKKRRDNELQK